MITEKLEPEIDDPPVLPKNVNLENANEIISILGIERIRKVYNLVSWQPVSFAALAKVIKFEEIEKALDNNWSLSEISKRKHVSKNTIYRIFKKKLSDKHDNNIQKMKE